MPKKGMVWVYSPPKPPKPKVPDTVRQEVSEKANALVETLLKPKFIKPPSPDERFNYIVDIFTKWFRGYLYFCATYHCPGPNATSPSFETRFTRLEYAGPDRFNLAYMRYTEQWQEVYRDLSLDECLESIREEAFFWP